MNGMDGWIDEWERAVLRKTGGGAISIAYYFSLFLFSLVDRDGVSVGAVEKVRVAERREMMMGRGGQRMRLFVMA